MTQHPLSGVYAAALTPLKADSTPDPEPVPAFLAFLADRGCHGALLFGTTGVNTRCKVVMAKAHPSLQTNGRLSGMRL